MESQVRHRRVGQVEIFDLIGELKGSLARSTGQRMATNIQISQAQAILFNAQALRCLDDAGIEAILGNASRLPKNAFITNNEELSQLLQRADSCSNKNLSLFQNEEQAAFYLAKEFVQSNSIDNIEKREFPRLRLGLPLHLYCESCAEDENHFFAVVTNLSEGGLFADFIGTRSEKQILKKWNIFDLPKVVLEIHLCPTEIIKMKGKMQRISPDHGVGIEFEAENADDKTKLDSWIASQRQWGRAAA